MPSRCRISRKPSTAWWPDSRRRAACCRKRSGFGGERDYSEATARTIDEEVRAILDRTHDRVRGLLTTKKSALVAAATELKRVETLEGEPLRRLLNGDAAGTNASRRAPLP